MTGDHPTGVCFDVQRFAVHDGPGIRTTVFLKGCPLTCSWCHNPEGRAAGPEIHVFPERCIGCGTCHEVCPTGETATCLRCGACAEACPADARRLIGKTWTAAELVEEVARDRPFFEESGGGVTFSGGEPLAQPDFLLACLGGCRERGLHTTVDTCGYAEGGTILEVARFTDLFLYDLKIIDATEHRRLTGAPVEPILANLRALDGLGSGIWIRTPILPGINDGEGAIDALGRFVSNLPRTRRIHLLPHHAMGRSKGARMQPPVTMDPIGAPSATRLAEIAGRLAEHGLSVKIGGA